jgi:hypothetical protein
VDSKWNDSAPDLVKDLFLTRGLYHIFLLLYVNLMYVSMMDLYICMCVLGGGERGMTNNVGLTFSVGGTIP